MAFFDREYYITWIMDKKAIWSISKANDWLYETLNGD
jgi:hypothetical protein